MTAPSMVISLYGLLMLGSGIIAYTNTESFASLVGGSAAGLGLLASGLGVLRRKELGFVFAPFITLLLIVFFAYRLVLNGNFIPSGLMGTLGFVALVLYCSLPAKNISRNQPGHRAYAYRESADRRRTDAPLQHPSAHARADQALSG
mgnify:FL=1